MARSGSTGITVTNTAAGPFEWQPVAGSTDFTDFANWSIGTTAPGGANVALFSAGNHTATGNGAVGQIIDLGATTLTGNITAQGIGGLALSVDGGGALTLTGGALLNAQQKAVVGRTGEGLLLLTGAALAVGGSSADDNLVIGQNSGSTGTVLNLEQISVNGTAVVGAAGTGTLELLGVASSMFDDGADIGQSVGARGSVIVNGGEWTNSGLLAVGDAGTGSLMINGMNRGITGQVTAYAATIGNQTTGQGSVTLDGGELLVANVFAASSTLVVGNDGTGSLVLENGSEVAVGAAQGTLANNTGPLVVGAAGTGLARIGAYSSLLVYGYAIVGGGSGTGQVIVGQRTDDGALFALNGALHVGAHGQVTLGGTNATLRAADIDIAQGGTISGTGTVSGVGGGNNTVALAAIDNDGSIVANGGDLLVYGYVGGSGTLGVGTGATLTLQAAVESGQTLAFGSNARAVLNDPLAFDGTITGFDTGDVLELASTQATSVSWTPGWLTLETTAGTLQFGLAGNYVPDTFTVTPDGLGGTNVAGGRGDVHMMTFDGQHYDFQAVGQFVAVRSTEPGAPWQIQIETAGTHGIASITTELAAEFDDAAVVFALGRPISLHVDGAPDTMLYVDGAHSIPGGMLTRLSSNTYQLAWNTGETIVVSYQGDYLDWGVSLGPDDGPGSVQGLLGSHSGQGTDFHLPDGTILPQPLSNEEIVGAYADAWRVAAGYSLLDF